MTGCGDGRDVRMKKKVIFLLAGFCLIVALLPSCTGNLKEEDLPGGLRDGSDTNTPKSIASKEITRFECEFLADASLNYGYYFFRMERKSDGALCSATGIDDFELLFDLEFTAPLSALDELQDMIDEHHLIELNGIDKHTNGLPENLGSLIHVTYASGERLYAYDNSSSVLSNQAALALHDLFRDLAQEAGHHFSADEEKDMEG
jgi:hypothetical protein